MLSMPLTMNFFESNDTSAQNIKFSIILIIQFHQFHPWHRKWITLQISCSSKSCRKWMCFSIASFYQNPFHLFDSCFKDADVHYFSKIVLTSSGPSFRCFYAEKIIFNHYKTWTQNSQENAVWMENFPVTASKCFLSSKQKHVFGAIFNFYSKKYTPQITKTFLDHFDFR